MKTLIHRAQRAVSHHWSKEGGYREFLAMAFPLILATGSWSVQHFVDRMFLTWYSPAAMPAGMLNFTPLSLFQGMVGYVDVFIAQYYGANQRKMIGPVLWQGIYLALLGGLVILAISPFSQPIFNFIGHDPAVRENEIVFFRTLCYGAFPVLASVAMSGFFAGRGETWILVWVNVAATAVTIVLDYLLIFGNLGCPELGMQGAALATVASGVFTFLLYAVLIFRRRYLREFPALLNARLQRPLMQRLVRYGFPSGVQFFIDIIGFTAFIMIMGTLGTVSLAATNIALNINTLAFMPMLGGGIAVSVLVGQYQGKKRPDLAQRSAYSAFHICFGYMATVALLFVVVPDLFLAPFTAKASPENIRALRPVVLVLMRFIAVYSLFDTLNIIFGGAIKGAGDTHFVMRMLAVISVCVLVIPTYVALIWLHAGLYTGWTIGSCYVAVLGIGFWLRFRNGKWKSIRVIEESPVPSVPPVFPENPA
jgi:MATE family multidrug resistance protein